jgi:hypothetical protein
MYVALYIAYLAALSQFFAIILVFFKPNFYYHHIYTLLRDALKTRLSKVTKNITELGNLFYSFIPTRHLVVTYTRRSV